MFSQMNSLENLMAPRRHLVGWIVVAGKSNENVIKSNINEGLESFVGDYGPFKEVRTATGFGFGLLKPDDALPLTTWSFFEDREKTCFIEGVFYEDYFSHQPVNCEDQELAKILLKEFGRRGKKAIEQLNGSFSGFIFDHAAGELITFIDRLGVHVLYWSYENGNIIVSSNLAAFRRLKKLSLDQTAAFQFLTVGFPIEERTLLEGVKIQLPCTMNTYDGTSARSIRYWDVPKRMKGISLNECVEMISQSVEGHVERVYERTRLKMGFGMSGGHDSRVILSALAYRGIPFEAAIWKDNNFNDAVTAKLCALLNKRPIIVRNVSGEEMEEIQKNVFAYTDGNYMYSHGFARLAKECYEQECFCLMLGYAGDRISGCMSIPAPQELRSVEQMAAASLRNQMELLTFGDALGLMKLGEDVMEETLSEWRDSFIKESSHEHLSDVSIWQGLSNRNLKRIRFSMIPARQYVQLIFPYLDNKVLDAYMSMPIKYLSNQKAHCYAGFHRIDELGDYQACSYPVALRREARFPSALYLLRYSWQKTMDVLSAFRSSGYKGNWDDKHYKICDDLCRSPLLNHNILRELFVRKKVQPKGLYKMHTLSRFYEFYVLS